MSAVPKFTESQVYARAEELWKSAPWKQICIWYESAPHVDTDKAERFLRESLHSAISASLFAEQFRDVCWEACVEDARSELMSKY